jgi:putative intracellular protease/amidase
MGAVLLVLTSHDRRGDTGRHTGFYLPEAAQAWRVFSDAGWRVDLVSPKGGRPPVDGVDDTDPVQRAFLDEVDFSDTPRPDQVNPADYDAVLYVGGLGAMWDFPGNPALARLGAEIHESGGVVAAVCHGPAGLLDIVLPDGRHLVDGRAVAGFTNAEEAAGGMTEVVPFLLEDALRERGGKHTSAPNFEPHVVVDGRLVTGQNPASTTGVAQAVVDLVGVASRVGG